MAKQIWKPGNMIYPLPAVMVSCQREGEKPNIITVAWTGTVCTNPPMVYISVRPQRYSYDILDETGEFVINLTTKELARATDYCGVRSGRDVDKFKDRADCGGSNEGQSTADRGSTGQYRVPYHREERTRFAPYVPRRSTGSSCR